ncbi:alpha/beta hydrolase [Chloroflexota bacterium]
MSGKVDYSVLDLPQFQQLIFYPRAYWTIPQPGATDHMVSVEGGISISARFYPISRESPTILFFHGNGEVACEYDDIAPLYNKQGINLVVADYRGYGRSGGLPTFANMVADAHAVLDYVRVLLQKGEYTDSLFIMGRSLGSHSAIELASARADEVQGLILESGFAHVPRLLRHHGLVVESPALDEFEEAVRERVKGITIPVLVIHGEWDTLVPPENATNFNQNVGSKDKTLLTIPHASHNDIMYVGMEQYFSSIKAFVSRLAGLMA